MNYDKDQKIYLDKIDELLSLRESKKSSLNNTNKMISQGLNLIKSMPIRWYVRNNGQKEFQSIIKYLQKKHKRKNLSAHIDCGLGELHGEIAFVPHDCQYPWEITQDEFNFLSKNISK